MTIARPGLLRLLTFAALFAGGPALWAGSLPTVVVLFSDPTLLPATANFTKGLTDGLTSAPVQVDQQFFDLSRFAGPSDEHGFVEWLASRYRDQAVPVVVPLGSTASRFASRHAAEIWPHARLVHASIDGDQLTEVLNRGEVAVPRVLQYRRTVEAALALFPKVRSVTLIAGASDLDRRWLATADDDLAALGDRVQIERLAGLRWQDVLDRVAHLPDDAIILPVVFFADADARAFVPADAVAEIANVADRPVLATFDAWMGHGPLGGLVMDSGLLGSQAAKEVLRALEGAASAAQSADASSRSVWVFDALQMRRWNVSERSLPAGSLILNRQPSFWQQYKWYAIGAFSLIFTQALLIGGLLVQRSRRRRAEQVVRTSETALRTSYERIRQLAGRLIGAQETARTRIARDLHDDVCQELASVSMAVGDLKAHHDASDVRTQAALSTLQRRTLDLAHGVRRLSHHLHPSTLRHVGLAAALETHCIEVEQRYDVQVSLRADTDLKAMPSDTSLALFRIAQEALRNAATHGNARRVALSISKAGDTFLLVIGDDGRGFNRDEASRRGGLGLVSMEERARLVDGQMVIVSVPGQGTTVTVKVPADRAVDPQRTPTIADDGAVIAMAPGDRG